MPNVDIHYLAVVVAAVINMAVGAVWYMPSVFGKPWSKMIGRKMEDMRSQAGLGYAVSTVGALVQAWILAHFVAYAGSTTALDGALTGFWLWLGFTGIVLATQYVFAGRRKKLWAIDAGYFFVVLIINGALLAAWH